MDIELIDDLASEHERSSCSDEESNGNEYFNEMGFPRCTRCALLYRMNYGEWPYGTTVEHVQLRFHHHRR